MLLIVGGCCRVGITEVGRIFLLLFDMVKEKLERGF